MWLCLSVCLSDCLCLTVYLTDCLTACLSFCPCVYAGVTDHAATAAAMATDVRPQDNRGFTDTNTAQKLTEGDIIKMKNDGRGGQAIIQVCPYEIFHFQNTNTLHLTCSFWWECVYNVTRQFYISLKNAAAAAVTCCHNC